MTIRVGEARIASYNEAISAFKHQLSLPQNEASEVRTIVGSTPLAMTMEDIKGRALMKREDVDVIQLALPVSGDNENQVLNNLRQEVASLQEAWTGRRPSAIPMVPEELTMGVFLNLPTTQEAIQNHELPIGLEFEMVQSVAISFNQLKSLIYLSDSAESLENQTHHLLNTSLCFGKKLRVMLVDPLEEYRSYSEKVSTYISSKKEISEIAQQLIFEVNRRLEGDLYSDWLIFMPNIKVIVEHGLSEKDLDFLFKNGLRVGLHFVIGGEHSYIGNNIHEVPKYLKSNAQWVMLGMRLMDQMFLDKPYNNREARLELDEVYLHDRKQAVKLKITKND